MSSIEEIAEWLEKVINKIGIDDFSILGHSQGCLIALNVFKYPKKQKFNFVEGLTKYLLIRILLI